MEETGYIVKDMRVHVATDDWKSLSQDMVVCHLRERGLSEELLDEILEEVQRACLGISKGVALAHPEKFTKGNLERVIGLAKSIRSGWSESVFERDPEDGHMKTAWRLCKNACNLYEEIERRHYHGRIPPETYLGDEATRALLNFHYHMEDNRVSEDGRNYTRAYYRTMEALASF